VSALGLGAVAGLIAARCPGLGVRSVAELGAGDFCLAYLVNGDRVFRFARHAEATPSLRREACLLPRIAPQIDLRVPVPEIASFDSEPAFVAYRLLPGPTLTLERYVTLPSAGRDRCTRQVASFLGQLHATDLGLARACSVTDEGYRVPFDGLLDRVRQHLSGIGAVSAPMLAWVERVIAEYRGTVGRSEYSPALLHGDLSSDHILIAEESGEATGIIDFGDMTIGDPAWDFVYLYEEYGADFVDRCARAYTTTDRPALLVRMYRLFVMNAITWAVQCAEAGFDELGEAVAQLGRLQADGERPILELTEWLRGQR
jgi:aminoglycoside 2''-phosphotransferase